MINDRSQLWHDRQGKEGAIVLSEIKLFSN